MNDECRAFIIHHSSFIILSHYPLSTNHYPLSMAIDAYSLCPGGTGKKIKFCCGDFLARTAEDRPHDRRRAVSGLPAAHRPAAGAGAGPRSGVSAGDEVRAAAGHRPARGRPSRRRGVSGETSGQPGRPGRIGDSCRRERRPRGAGLLQRAMRAADGDLAGRTYQAMGLVAGGLLHAGFPLAARALLQLQCDIADEDDRPAEMLAALSQAADIPLLLRDDPPLVPCPDDVPWKDRFDEADAGGRRGRLADGGRPAGGVGRRSARFAGHLAQPGDAPRLAGRQRRLHRGPAEVRGAAGRRSRTAWRTPSRPRPRRCSSPTIRWATGSEMFKIVWTVKDVERSQEALLSSPRWRPIPFDPAQFSDGETPPPKGAYMLLDRPMPESAEGLSLETMPQRARPGAVVRAADRPRGPAGGDGRGGRRTCRPSAEMVREAAGEAVEPEPKQESIGHWSASQKLLRTAWQPPRGASPEQIRAMIERARSATRFSTDGRS